MTFCYVLKSGMQIDCAHAIQLYLHMLLPPHPCGQNCASLLVCMHSSHVQALPHVGWSIWSEPTVAENGARIQMSL